MEEHEWVQIHSAWSKFVDIHPELGYKKGHWPLHNFLRFHRDTLVGSDAIRLAKRRHWIAHVSRFLAVAFDAATGRPPIRSA